MSKQKSIGRRIVGVVVVLVFGILAGAAFPERAVSAPQCGLEMCTTSGCAFSYNDWYCDQSGGGCITRECGTGELMCPPLGICRE
jgi:hypothetical protein